MTKDLPTRRTNLERSASTQEKLLNATEECLIELGYSRTTTKEVCKRAGVSTGSLLHHFQTRNNLLAATLQNIYNRFGRQMEAAAGMGASDSIIMDNFVRELFDIFDDHAMKAMIELWLASSNDRELHDQVFPVMQEFSDGTTALAVRCLPALQAEPDVLARTMRSILITLQGYALALIAFGRDQPGEQEVLEFLHGQARDLLDTLGIREKNAKGRV